METLAWPSHSWTLAISASYDRALVAAVARRMDAEPVYLSADARLQAVFQDDVAVDGVRVERLLQFLGAVIRHRAEHGGGGIGAVAGEGQVPGRFV